MLGRVQHAAKLLKDVSHRTPIFTSRTVDAIAGCQIFFKCENLQRTGSFKFRGAFNALSQLTDEEREKGVVTHSSGNHGQAVAAAAQAMGGVPAVVVVPKDTPQVKVDAIAGYGAEVVLCEPSQKSRTETSEDIAERSGKILIPPYNHPDVMAGQGTIGLELLQEIPDLDGIVVPTSGGGMIAGIAAAARSIRPECRVFATEPTGKRLQESIAMGQR
eukprot:gene27210-26022_t